jgi:hypothetical protein
MEIDEETKPTPSMAAMLKYQSAPSASGLLVVVVPVVLMVEPGVPVP